MKTPTIAVIGSVNLDLVARVERFPVPGETLTDAVVSRHPGGKGANQALAARRLGAEVALVACLGADSEADEALANLIEAGVDISGCQRLEEQSTGLAMIMVNDEGENQIVVAPGANKAFTREYLKVPEADAVVAQLELPMKTIEAIASRVSDRGDCLFCLNAAPIKPVPETVLEMTDLLIVNQVEAREIGSRLDNFSGWLVVTLGARGAELYHNGTRIVRALSPEVDVVDTTGAGDAFTAAMVTSMAKEVDPDSALQRACYAGALATTRPGAQASATAAELDAFITQLSGR